MASTKQDQQDDWSGFDFSSVKLEKERLVHATTRKEIFQTIILGLISGLLVWLIYLALNNWVVWPLFCRTPDTATVCTNSSVISFTIAIIIVATVSTLIMITRRTQRAIIVSLATFACVGALWLILDKQNMWIAMIISAIFASLLYVYFILLGSIKQNLLAFGSIIFSVILFWIINLV